MTNLVTNLKNICDSFSVFVLNYLHTILVLLGVITLIVAAFIWNPLIGVVVLGVALIIFGVLLDKPSKK